MLVKIEKTDYMGTKRVVGGVVNATLTENFDYMITKEELVRVGADCAALSDGASYCFWASEVEVYDKHSSNLVKDAIEYIEAIIETDLGEF
jgi:hypothetical protein